MRFFQLLVVGFVIGAFGCGGGDDGSTTTVQTPPSSVSISSCNNDNVTLGDNAKLILIQNCTDGVGNPVNICSDLDTGEEIDCGAAASVDVPAPNS